MLLSVVFLMFSISIIGLVFLFCSRSCVSDVFLVLLTRAFLLYFNCVPATGDFGAEVPQHDINQRSVDPRRCFAVFSEIASIAQHAWLWESILPK